MLTISDKAAEKIRELVLEDRKSPEEIGLRIEVEGGGCSGFQYRMDLATQQEGDNVYERDGTRVFIDPKSLVYVSGSEVDYVDALTGAGFTIRNPKSTGTCGCGMSFSV